MSKTPPPAIPMVWSALALGIWAVHAVGALAPRSGLWGFHFAAYLPPAASIALFLATGLLLAWASRTGRLEAVCHGAAAWAARRQSWTPVLLAAAGVTFVACFLARERLMVFGDSLNVAKYLGNNETFSSEWLRPLLTLSIESGREALVVFIHRLVSHLAGVDIVTVYAVMSALAGAGTVAAWLWVCGSEPTLRPWLAPLLVLGIFAGGNALYLGHVEHYALPAAVATLFLALALKTEPRSGALPLLLLFLLLVRLQLIYAALFPVAWVVLARALGTQSGLGRRLLSPSAVLGIGLALPLLAGGLLYAFHFRAATWRTDIATPLFLPVSGVGYPWRSYTLVSWTHAADYLNVLGHVAFPALPILAGAIGLARGRRLDRDPLWLALASSVVLLSAFYFTAHSALAMPRDWDLFALLVPALAALTARTLGALPDPPRHRAGALLAAVVGLVFVVTGWVVNWTPRLLGPRLADVAVHVFDGYESGAAQILSDAAFAGRERTDMPGRIRDAVHRMTPRPQPPDAELARAHFILSQLELQAGHIEDGVRAIERSIALNPEDATALKRAAGVYLSLKRTSEARACLARLRRLAPGDLEVWKAEVRLECGTGDRTRCLDALAAALERFPADPDLVELRQKLAPLAAPAPSVSPESPSAAPR